MKPNAVPEEAETRRPAQPGPTSRESSESHESRQREAPCAATAIVAAGVAVCLVAVVWATYAAFDNQVFDLQQAVWQPAPDAARPPAVARAPMREAGTQLVAGPRGTDPDLR